jgi:hypothetical protein
MRADQSQQENAYKPAEWKPEKCRKAIRDDYAFDRFPFLHSELPHRDEPFGDHDWDESERHRREMEEQHRDPGVCENGFHALVPNATSLP